MIPGDAVTRKLVTFGRILREGGLEVGPGRLQDALRGLAAVDLTSRDEVYHALRCTLVSRHDEIAVFDAAFAAFWERAPSPPGEMPDLGIEMPQPEQAAPPREPMAEGEEAENDDLAAAVYSPTELLRRRDFARMTPDELRRMRRLMEHLPAMRPMRRSRRLTPAPGRGVLDVRRTLRGAMYTGGVPLERSWRRPKLVPRRLVVLCDVSGSMEPYARAMVMFLQALVAPAGAGRTVEAFGFGTRLTHLTPHLSASDPAVVLERAAAALPDWGGGTRIGESLETFNRLYGRRGAARGAVVVIVSDGWERGDLGLLDQELARLKRSCSKLVWVNPLKGHEGFEPLAGGMRTALHHVDLLMEGHNLAALEALADALARLSPQGGSRAA